MEVHRCAGAEELLERAGAFLEEREPEHNLILGLLGTLREEPRLYGHEPYVAVVEERNEPVGAVVRTPPFGPVLSELADADAAIPVAEDLADVFGELPGVLGPREPAARFARAWDQLTKATSRLAMEQRIYAARSVTSPRGAPGRMRRYEPDDRELVIGWLRAFGAESQPGGIPPLDAGEWLDRRISSPEGGVVLWDHDGPVSVAGFGQATAHGIRIGPVYTPPELRRRGYATALTAALTQRLLDGGREFCVLSTDLANPTSNSIYQRVGYQPVSDVDQWRFDVV